MTFVFDSYENGQVTVWMFDGPKCTSKKEVPSFTRRIISGERGIPRKVFRIP